MKKELSAPRLLPKPATVFFSGGAPCLVWVRTGRTWRVKGRIWSRIGAVVSAKKRSVALKRRAQGFRLRDQADQRRAGGEREGVGAGQAGLDRGQRRRELDQRFLDRLLLVGEVAERGLGAADEAFDLGVAAAQFGGQRAEVVDHAGQRQAPLRRPLC